MPLRAGIGPASLGNQASTFGPAADIVSSQPLDIIVADRLSVTLRKAGLSPVAGNASADARLNAELRLFEYSMQQGIVTFGLTVHGAMKVHAERNGHTYDKLYRVEVTEDVALALPEPNVRILNRAMNDLMEAVANDRDLLAFYSKR